jgi:hypothetical protein
MNNNATQAALLAIADINKGLHTSKPAVSAATWRAPDWKGHKASDIDAGGRILQLASVVGRKGDSAHS